MVKKIRKAVIPVAGFGTRFLPATKAMPKEMLPVVDKPTVQFIVEEAVAAGIEDIILVTGWHKRIIEDHFDYPFELEKRLEESGKLSELKEIRRIAGLANFIYIRQKGPYGNGTPVLNAKSVIGDEPFLVLWGDEIFDAQPGRSAQLLAVYNKYQAPVIACQWKDDKNDANKYGVVYGKKKGSNVTLVESLLEKPGPDKVKTPFLASLSGYILTPEIFPVLENLKAGKDGEIWLPDAINVLAQTRPVYACALKNAVHCDTGSKLAYIKTNLHFALKRKEFQEPLKKYLREILKNKSDS